MNDTGRIIRELRIRAGFTQKSLADALHITDKAVSKWERGVSLPDVTLFPKLSLLLDTDIDQLITKRFEQVEWTGLIDIHGCDLSQKVYDKPLVYYLLIHYLLLNIKKIHFLTDKRNEEYLKQNNLKKLGFDFSFSIPKEKYLMIMNQPWFIFGSDLTSQFQGAMVAGRNTKLVPQNQEPVVFFSYGDDSYLKDSKHFIKTASTRTLGRGMICINMKDQDKILETASFVRTYQKNSGLLIAALEEVNQKSIE